MGIKIITPATAPIIPLADVKLHLKVDTSTDDAYITSLIAAAANVIQHRTQSSVGEQTLELGLDEFPPGAIELPRGPVTSVVSVRYYDSAEVLQIISPTDYVLDTYSETSWLLPGYGLVWPETLRVANAVLVRYVAGSVSESVRAAILLLVGHWHENRQAVSSTPGAMELPMGVAALLAESTVWSM